MSANRWGQAKREVIALKPLISQRLESGITVRQIWLELHGEGRVSVTLRNFYNQVGKLLQPQPVQNKPATGQAGGGLVLFPTRTVTVSKPPVASSPEDAITAKFDHNNSPCEGELW
ncbi:MAG: hypothetical protein H7Z12_17690 [Rhodospirillaceae bacterium]|nr:hypothetical protein [Rhodospirillales bacterium]